MFNNFTQNKIPRANQVKDMGDEGKGGLWVLSTTSED